MQEKEEGLMILEKKLQLQCINFHLHPSLAAGNISKFLVELNISSDRIKKHYTL